MDTQKYYPSKYALRTCHMRKQPGSLHLKKYSRKHDWGTGLKLPLLSTYDQIALELRLSCTVHIWWTQAWLVSRDSHRQNEQGAPQTWILGSSKVMYGVSYFLTLPNIKCAQNTAFYSNNEFMSNYRRHRKILFATLSSSCSSLVSDTLG